MAGQDFTLEPRDSWPKTESTLDAVAQAVGYVIMVGQIITTEIIPEFIAKNLHELYNQTH